MKLRLLYMTIDRITTGTRRFLLGTGGAGGPCSEGYICNLYGIFIADTGAVALALLT